MSETPSTSSRLLKLPAELRNRIYRLTFVQDHIILVTRQKFIEPHLLYVCKDIRHEATSSYYGENEFCLGHVDFDSDVQLKWRPKCRQVRREHKVRITVFDGMMPRRIWANLLTWLKRNHAGSADGFGRSDAKVKSESTAISEMFAVCDDLGDIPWKRVAGIMGWFRNVLVDLHGDWEKEDLAAERQPDW